MMSLVRLIVIALALASTSSSFHQPETERNQYRSVDKAPALKNQKVPDLQVGCGDGNIREADLKKGRIPSRRKRNLPPWSTGQIAYPISYPSINVWKPPIQSLSRPYIVPVYGTAGRPLIYFPPQPIFQNPGVPRDNPKKFHGPQYLPPKGMETTTMSIRDRFDDFDDRPVWDLDDNEQTTRAPASSNSIVPTRAPRPPGGGAPPPLIHNPTDSDKPILESSVNELVPPPKEYPVRPPSSTRPPPSRTTTARPNEPTRCVWAIISCCSSSGQISYECFEQRGCPGAFWDNSPCDSDFAKAAIAAALNYYN